MNGALRVSLRVLVLASVSLFGANVFADPPTAPAASYPDPVRTCMAECSAIHLSCVSTNDLYHCIYGTTPNGAPMVAACAALSRQTANALQIFCNACGGQTHGCNRANTPAPRAQHESTARPTTHASATAAPQHPTTTSSPQAVADAAPAATDASVPSTNVAPVADAAVPTATDASVADVPVDAAPPPADASVPSDAAAEPAPDPSIICRNQLGRWDPGYVIPVRDEGGRLVQELHGVCWTHEGQAIMQSLVDMTARINRVASTSMTEPRVREIATEEARTIVATERTNREAADAVILSSQLLQSRRLDTLDRRVNDLYVHPPTTFGVRLNGFAGVGLVRLWQSSVAPIPYFLGGEINWDPSVGDRWNAEVGLGVGYAGPDTNGVRHLALAIHGGALWRPLDFLGLGFGATLNNRLTDEFRASHILGGPYGEIIFNLNRFGWTPTVSIRGIFGAGYRFTDNGNLLDPDGAVMLLLGFAHMREPPPSFAH